MAAPTPYAPTAFTTPIVNPAIGGSGTPYPYLSISQYKYAPTSVDVANLYTDGSAPDQDQVLADTIRRASNWADRIVFGSDPAAKGASLCATLSIENAQVPVLNGELRLVCDYRPIIQVNGVDVGWDMATLSSVGSGIAGSIRIGRRTIYVPIRGFASRANDSGNPEWRWRTTGFLMAVWSYVNGYPHTQLSASITSVGATTVSVQPTDGGTGLLGITPNQTQMTIVDGAQTERFTVSAVSGTTLTSATPLLYKHTLPTSPDFISVTTLPEDVTLAVIFLTNTLIKTTGDNALVLEELTAPKQIQKQTGDEFEDFNIACRLLRPFGVSVKQKV